MRNYWSYWVYNSTHRVGEVTNSEFAVKVR
jgi:hypothetical protein